VLEEFRIRTAVEAHAGAELEFATPAFLLLLIEVECVQGGFFGVEGNECTQGFE